MGFALTSFTPIHPPEGEKPSPAHYGNNVGDNGGSSRPGSTAHTAPNSPISHRCSFSNPNLAPMMKQPHLTAQQIYELAMESTGNTQPSTPSSPATSIYGAGRPVRSRPTTPGASERPSPAVFTPMPDEVLLPFVNRPAEVTQLLNELPTSRLFNLLRALFPENMHHMKEGEEDEEDPTKWSFTRLSQLLMETTRTQCDDKLWVELARTWALGVPVELEVDDEDDEDDEDVGIVLEGADLITHTPEDLVPSESINGGLAVPPRTDESVPDIAYDSRSVFDEDLDEPKAVLEPVFADEELELGHTLEQPLGPSASGYFPSGASESGFSNRYMENIGEGEEEEEDERSRSAAAAVAPASRDPDVHIKDYATHETQGLEHELLPLGSRRAHFGIPDSPEDSPTSTNLSDKDRDREIRALQITTSPAPSSLGRPTLPVGSSLQHSTSPLFRPVSNLSIRTGAGDADTGSPATSIKPLEHEPVDTLDSPASTDPASHSSAATVLPLPAGTGGRRRPSEAISEAINGGASRFLRDPKGYQGFGGFGLTNPNKPYHPALSERGPGNPLFPSSFAGLSVAPTLSANVRSVSMSHGTEYPASLSHSLRSTHEDSGRDSPLGLNLNGFPLRRIVSVGGGRHRVRSGWGDIKDRYEYAVTTASASSDGGRG
ncbi:uncharacterized protein EI90DRAFT_3068456 [Cantharellus anzutake]|uniref:uncharacterized protein n=1 Tax=Cantharellus anzutake TaxID=1750568 RepID=UPI0019069CF9|nr:uncharacterized protein EI90DRAFT_3068456 [Cantharellus anzutake]KAF8327265.1 hypothetical protein EI90DRAFT_3068456 [Cantharellus anzutake]